MDVDLPSSSFTNTSTSTKQVRYANVAVQTDPVQVFPIPVTDPREIAVAEDVNLQNKRLAVHNKNILEQRKKLYAQRLSKKRARQINHAMKIAQSIDSPLGIKPKMVRTSGPPGVSAPKLSLPAFYYSPSDQLKNLQIEEEESTARPPTPGANIPSGNEEQLLASDSEA